ncbi:MAG: NYN domain-containing protein [Ignavibacteria bacterium]|nr:NYN domain-containing protein [Ignavibacteria bacterium]
MKTIIIDSNNLIHKVLYLKNLFMKDKESAQISLAETVKVRLSRNEKVIFVFDGFGKTERKDVIFSKELTADEIIRKKIENFSDHRKLKVVSSDTGITKLAKVCGCEVQSSESFWDEINKVRSETDGKNINQFYIYDKPEKPDRLSKKELEEFKKYFS